MIKTKSYHELLADWMEVKGVTVARMAERVGVSYKHVYLITQGDSRPSWRVHEAMVDELDLGDKEAKAMHQAWLDLQKEKYQ